jgi:hypothetical protein
MAKYIARLPNGKSIEIPSDKPLTDEELAVKIAEYAAGQKEEAAPAPMIMREAFFPRTARAVVGGRDAGAQRLSAGLDLLSLPGRTIRASSVQAPYPDQGPDTPPYDAREGERIKQETMRLLSETDPKSFLASIVTDPGTGAAVLTLPVTAPMAAGGAMAAAGGAALEGAASAAAHQSENLLEEGKVKPGQAAAEVGLSIAIPGGAFLGKKGVKALGSKIIEYAVKPAKKLKRGRGSQFVTENIFKYNLDSPKGLKAMDEKIRAFKESISKQYGDELLPIKDKRINLAEALNKAEKELEAEIQSGQHAADFEGVREGIKYWRDYVQKSGLGIKNGMVRLEDLLAIRRGVGQATSFGKVLDRKEMGFEKAAKKLYRAINDKLDAYSSLNKKTRFRELDKTLSEVEPISSAIGDAVERIAKNNPVSLLDAAGIGSLGMGMLSDLAFGSGGIGSALGAASLGGIKAMQMPSVGSMMYRGAGAIPWLALMARRGAGTTVEDQ